MKDRLGPLQTKAFFTRKSLIAGLCVLLVLIYLWNQRPFNKLPLPTIESIKKPKEPTEEPTASAPKSPPKSAPKSPPKSSPKSTPKSISEPPESPPKSAPKSPPKSAPKSAPQPPPKSPEFFPTKSSVLERLKKGVYNESTKVFHVLTHTHWDKEWYQPYEKFRRTLVLMFDQTLDLLKNDPNFFHFHPDGQTSVIEDFLQIRPHKIHEIREATSKNFISVGPWYTQPDNLLCYGESLVRNLNIGMEFGKQYGDPSLISYLPDTFGHISQLPQILKDVGLRSTVIGRGVDMGMAPSEMRWKGVDGSEIFVHYASTWYCNGFFFSTSKMSDAHEDAQVLEWFETKLNKVMSRSAGRHTILYNGCDHGPINPDIANVIRRGDRLMSEKYNIRVVHSTLTEYDQMVQEDMKAKGRDPLTRIEGRLNRGSDVRDSLANIYSTKMSQKQQNWRNQYLLAHYTEPLSALYHHFSIQLNDTTWRYDHDMLEHAWKLLLQNHAHDSIGACSVQEVHKDVDSRFERSIQIGDSLFAEPLVKFMHMLKFNPSMVPHILVYNPYPHERNNELVFVTIHLINGLGGSEDKVCLVDSNGNPVRSYLVKSRTRHDSWGYIQPDQGFRLDYRPQASIVLGIVPKNLPALGYEVFTLQQTEPQKIEFEPVGIGAPFSLKNEFLHVNFSPHSWCVSKNSTDGEDRRYCNIIELCTDIGSEYQSMIGGCNTLQGVYEGLEQNNVFQKVTLKLSTPKQPIHVHFVLLHNSTKLDVRVSFENRFDNFRIQSVFKGPSGVVSLETPFDIVDLSGDSGYFSQQSFFRFQRQNSDFGLVVGSRGLPEIQVFHDHVGLTLLRGVDRMGDWGHFPVDAQEHGNHAMEYTMLLFEGEDKRAEASRIAKLFSLPIVAKQILDYGWRGPFPTASVDLKNTELSFFEPPPPNSPLREGAGSTGMEPAMPKNSPKRNLPLKKSFLKLQPQEIIMSTFRVMKATNNVMVRVFNPTSKTLNATFDFSGLSPDFKTGWSCFLNETRSFKLQLNQSVLSIPIASKKIVTIEIEK